MRRFYVFTRRARVRPKLRLYSEILKAGGGRSCAISAGKGRTHQFGANSREALGHSGLGSAS